MYNIRQFQPCLYLLLLLGMSGFALASQTPGVWMVGCGGVVLNAWLMHTHRFRPLPRVVANLITIVAMLYATRELVTAGSTPVLVIGQFLVALQLVKLWEQRANRDYGQLLVLSLLQMVAATISTASLLFGVMFAVYLFLALYCCLLFHLKVETDTAKAAFALPEEKINPATLRQDQRFLARSMRRLTVMVSGAAVAMAVGVFLLFPRGPGQGLLGPVQFKPAQALTGFSDQVSFDQVARITQNTEKIARVEVFKDEQRVTDGHTLWLRGCTLDTYRPNGPFGQWLRTISEPDPEPVHTDEPFHLRRHAPEAAAAAPGEAVRPAEHWRQRISLRPTGTKVLFSMAGPVTFTPHRDVRIRYTPDGAILSEDPLQTPLDYEVISTNVPDDLAPHTLAGTYPIDERIRQYALRPEVSGSDPDGPLAPRRLPGRGAGPNPLDARIAASIARHLRGPGFYYTLDITDARTRHEQDPFVWFLSDDGHRGHCEYFAGAMTLMCQSLGMNARMVIGFRCDEYNGTPGADYYIVRQAHAHAWVEVLTTEGWMTFDPTSGREGDAARRQAGWWQSVRHFFDFLEYSYANHVIAYDNDSRENLIQAVEDKMTRPALRNINSGGWVPKLLNSETFRKATGSLVGGAVTLGSVALAVIGLWWLTQNLRLRRRVARIGIESLPPAEQVRLARQLGFYDDLLRLLGRHQITRAPHETPLEFSQSLLFLPSDVYETVHRLTGIFYRVRYGKADLSPRLQRHLSNVIARTDAALLAALPKAV